MGAIKQLLLDLDLINENNLEVLSTKTRDEDDLLVLRDKNTDVIFIDDFLPSADTYKTGSYREDLKELYGKRDYEITEDTRRRAKDYKQFYIGKKIIDFGCGEGSFLTKVSSQCLETVGIEIEKSYVQQLNKNGIKCTENIISLSDNYYDTIFCFHTFEHLSDPLFIIQELQKKLVPGGTLIVEVPHAKDFLLNYIASESFKNFTLWSQHLILHTRISLERFFKSNAFEHITIQGIQRYNLANHMNWLVNGLPGGHKKPISIIETNELRSAYENSLRMIDATDTLVAIGSKVNFK